MTQRWTESGNYQALMRQISVDIATGLKNGVKPREAKQALRELCREIQGSFIWQPITPNKPK